MSAPGVDWPRTVHRTHREASPVDRACAVQRFRTRRRSVAPYLVAAAVVGAVAIVVVHLAR